MWVEGMEGQASASAQERCLSAPHIGACRRAWISPLPGQAVKRRPNRSRGRLCTLRAPQQIRGPPMHSLCSVTHTHAKPWTSNPNQELHSQRDRENLIAEYTSTVNELKDRLAAQNQNQGGGGGGMVWYNKAGRV